jgi:hypothetical protein
MTGSRRFNSGRSSEKLPNKAELSLGQDKTTFREHLRNMETDAVK